MLSDKDKLRLAGNLGFVIEVFLVILGLSFIAAMLTNYSETYASVSMIFLILAIITTVIKWNLEDEVRNGPQNKHKEEN